jgi:integrase
VTPVRAVLNNINDSESGIAFRVRGYTQKEKVDQDNKRKSTGRKKYPPGSWEWLLKFRQKASPRLGALALLMFVTGARISQAVSMHPRKHINKAKGMVCIPGAKGHGDRWLRVPDEVMAELTALPEIYPRDWPRKPENLRLFGYADRGGPRKLWAKACKAAGIEQIPFHPAGRHGFGQEMNVREKVDEKAAGAFGGWSDLNLMRNTYTHAEDTETKINEALRRGLVKAEIKTKLKLRKEP